MYLEIESAKSRRTGEKEKLVLDIVLLISLLHTDNWNRVRACMQKILGLPVAAKSKILNDPAFHKFTILLNGEILDSFQKKIPTPLSQSLSEYINILFLAINYHSGQLIDLNSIENISGKSFLLPGSDILIHYNAPDHTLSRFFLQQVDGIKIISEKIDPFFSETLIYNAECDFEAEIWITRLKEAIGLIKLNSDCNTLLEHFVDYIFPLKQKIKNVDFSFTSRHLPNVVFKNLEDSAYLFGESLIHEGDHSFFYFLEEAYSFWKENANYQEEVYFSPWREDPRPLIGILRGLSAFTRVSMYYAALFENLGYANTPVIGQLLLLKINQCQVAASTLLTSGQLAEDGVNVVMEMKIILEGIDNKVSASGEYSLWKTLAVNLINEKRGRSVVS